MEIGRMLMEYCLNAVWLAPVAAGAACLVVKLAGLRPKGEHRVWLAAMAVSVALPGVGVRPALVKPPVPGTAVQAAVEPMPDGAVPVRLEQGPPLALESAIPVLEAASPNAWFERRLREVSVAPQTAGWFGWVYVGVVGFAALRLAGNWWAALRLVRAASPYGMNDAESAVLRGLADKLGVAVPRVLRSQRVRSPVLVGVRRPLLLLPTGFEECSEAERRAALCHELAHLRRRDCLVHAGVQMALLPLVWHPAAHCAARRIARSREMACDALAAAAMNSDAGGLTYARCLLNLARKMVGKENEAAVSVGLGLFRTNKLEERVMRLTEVKRVASMREMLVRRVGGAAVAGVVLAAGALVHVAPVVAQESTPAAPSAPAALSPAAPAPVPTPVPTLPGGAAPASSVAEGSTFGLGMSGTSSELAEVPGGVYQDAGGTHVMVKAGSHVHRWVGADGTKYKVRDGQAAPYTKAQERAAESEYRRRMAQAQEDLGKAANELSSPEFKAQIDSLSSSATAEAMKNARQMLAEASKTFDEPDFQAELAHWNSPEFKARMDAQMKELKRQMAQMPKLDGKTFHDETAAQLAAQLALAEKQAALADTPELQRKLDDAAKRLDEASARLDAAAKALAEAQKRLQETPK